MGQEVLFEQAHSSIINLKNVYFYYLDIVSYKNIKMKKKIICIQNIANL